MNVDDLLIDTDDVTEKVQQQGRRLVPWLENPHQCDCGKYCIATEEFVNTNAWVGPREIWECPDDDCGKRYYRERV